MIVTHQSSRHLARVHHDLLERPESCQPGKEVAHGSGDGGDVGHFTDFIECVRGVRKKPNSEIEEGQKSALLCHLGNIAYQLGRTIHFDPETPPVRVRGHLPDLRYTIRADIHTTATITETEPL